jgi:hypothetical protein
VLPQGRIKNCSYFTIFNTRRWYRQDGEIAFYALASVLKNTDIGALGGASGINLLTNLLDKAILEQAYTAPYQNIKDSLVQAYARPYVKKFMLAEAQLFTAAFSERAADPYSLL